jgi:ribosomal subunit interface protein
MTLRVSGKNMDMGESLRGRAEDHFDAVVKKYFDGGYDGHLTLAPDGIGYRADCVVHLDSGITLQAGAIGTDPIVSFETVAATIEKRLRRYNRKLKSHRARGHASTDAEQAQTYVLAANEETEELHEDYSPPVIAETTANLKRYTVGEAVMELDLTQSDVVVFRHAGHGGLNVVYRRADGNIGWIDPALSPN